MLANASGRARWFAPASRGLTRTHGVTHGPGYAYSYHTRPQHVRDATRPCPGRTGILDAIYEVNQVKTGVLLLGLNMDNGCHIDFRRFILEAIERKLASVENILDGIDGRPWECSQ
jgi:hypothetical protein